MSIRSRPAIALTACLLSAGLSGALAPDAAGDACAGNFDCPPGDYCVLPVGDCTPKAPVGFCFGIPGGCSTEWDPVCGCDYETYSNSCVAAQYAVSVLHPGVCQPCENAPCDPDEFCQLPEGACDTIVGVCSDIPDACAPTCGIVCGCDEATYDNACEAGAAGTSVDHHGPCNTSGDGLIMGLLFLASGDLIWQGEAGANSYNVYREVITHGPPVSVGECFLPGIPGTTVAIPGDPLPGETWMLQVNGNFAAGEGGFGQSADCSARSSGLSCF